MSPHQLLSLPVNRSIHISRLEGSRASCVLIGDCDPGFEIESVIAGRSRLGDKHRRETSSYLNGGRDHHFDGANRKGLEEQGSRNPPFLRSDFRNPSIDLRFDPHGAFRAKRSRFREPAFAHALIYGGALHSDPSHNLWQAQKPGRRRHRLVTGGRGNFVLGRSGHWSFLLS